MNWKPSNSLLLDQALDDGLLSKNRIMQGSWPARNCTSVFRQKTTYDRGNNRKKIDKMTKQEIQTMKLWYLIQVFQVEYDEAAAFIVRADSEQKARELAATQCCDEGPKTWLDPDLSTCDIITTDGEPEVLLRDVRWA